MARGHVLGRGWRAAMAGGLLAVLTGSAWAWPDIPVPPRAVTEDLGGPMVHNGAPTRSWGFSSPDKPRDVTAWFERQLGPPVARTTQGRKMVLGKAIDGFFVTIQLEATFPGTHGVVGITDVRSANANRQAYQAQMNKLLDRLPLGSRVGSHSTSEDGPRRSVQLLYANSTSLAINESHLIGMLKAEGLALERRVAREQRSNEPPAVLMFFRGPAKEATATLSADRDGETTVFLVTITGRQS